MPRPSAVTRILLAAAAAAAAAAPAGRPPPARPGGPATRFAVATYNINYGNPNLPLVVKTIRKARADLVCLQETNARSERHLRRHLARRYRHMAFHRGPAGSGFALLSRSPLRSVKYVPPKYGRFGMCKATVKLGGRWVQVATVHLCPVIPRPNESLLTTMLRTEVIRAKEIVHVHKQLSTRLPVILAGDFNSLSGLTAPVYVQTRGFVDSFASVTKDADKHVTWHWPYRGVDWRFRLDYIFHASAMKTRASRIIRSKASDHYLLVSILDWATKRTPATAATKPAASRPG